MPLRDTTQEVWHWTTTVAWIGFDIPDAPEGDFTEWGISGLKKLDEIERQVGRAVRQLVDAVCSGEMGVIMPPPNSRRYSGLTRKPTSLSADERSTICEYLRRRASPRSSNSDTSIPYYVKDFPLMRYRRGDVLELWTGENLEEAGSPVPGSAPVKPIEDEEIKIRNQRWYERFKFLRNETLGASIEGICKSIATEFFGDPEKFETVRKAVYLIRDKNDETEARPGYAN